MTDNVAYSRAKELHGADGKQNFSGWGTERISIFEGIPTAEVEEGYKRTTLMLNDLLDDGARSTINSEHFTWWYKKLIAFGMNNEDMEHIFRMVAELYSKKANRALFEHDIVVMRNKSASLSAQKSKEERWLSKNLTLSEVRKIKAYMLEVGVLSVGVA